MTKKPAPDTALADSTSDEVVFWFLDGVSSRNVTTPHRDLTRADIARLAYREAARRQLGEGTRPDPRTPDPEIVAEVLARIEASGRYSKTQPAPSEPTAPADPAPTPEG